MASEFFKEKEQEPIQEAPKTIKIGDNEMTEDEVQALIDEGRKVKDYETKYNTDFESAWSLYGKTQNENKALRDSIADYETRLNQAQTQPLNVDDEETRKQVREAGKKAGIVFEDELNQKVITPEKFGEMYIQFRQAERLNDDLARLETEIDGKDGRPPFNQDVILDFMQETGIKDPKIAYKAKYEAELDSFKERKLNEAKKPGFVSQTSTGMGSKGPSEVKVTKDNVNQMLREALERDNN